MVPQNLTEAFDKYCSRQGPSVLREEYEARWCTPGSVAPSVPLFDPLSNLRLAGALLPGKVQSRSRPRGGFPVKCAKTRPS